jgi:hypothetical protein
VLGPGAVPSPRLLAAGPFPRGPAAPFCSATQQSVVMATMSPTKKIWSRDAAAVEKRDLWSSLKHGFRGRCPRCGEGRLFRAFLKVDNRCSACGLDFTPHRTDDLPPPGLGSSPNPPSNRRVVIGAMLASEGRAEILRSVRALLRVTRSRPATLFSGSGSHRGYPSSG